MDFGTCLSAKDDMDDGYDGDVIGFLKVRGDRDIRYDRYVRDVIGFRYVKNVRDVRVSGMSGISGMS